MGPDRNNYEIWLVDYLDGNLDREKEALLLSFLDENPDIREEMANLVNFSIKPFPRTLSNWENLKKVPAEMSEKQFEMLCIAASENDLKNHQRAELEEILSGSTERRRIFELYQKVRLAPPADTFRHKYRLRKLTGSQKFFRYAIASVSVAAAAAIIIIVVRNPVAVPAGTEIATIRRGTPDASILKSSGEQQHQKSRQAIMNETGQALALHQVPVNKSRGSVSNDSGVYSAPPEYKIISELKRTDISKVPFTGSNLVAFQHDARLAEMNITPVIMPFDPEDNGPGQFIARFFREKIFKHKGGSEKGSRNGYDIADIGINKLNRLFGWNMSLQEDKDEKGEVKSVHFSSKLVNFSAPVKKGSSNR